LLNITTSSEALEWRELDVLQPYARNPRKHSKKQIQELSHSISKFGFTVPVLIDEAGGIIAGHGRIAAAALLGWSRVPVIVARDWSEAKKRAYVIADNKLATNSQWDHELLAGELEELRETDFADFSLLGFAKYELTELLGSPDIVSSDASDDDGDADCVTCPHCGHTFTR
jgi:ParB-like chromosome segregation protein Spo0J